MKYLIQLTTLLASWAAVAVVVAIVMENYGLLQMAASLFLAFVVSGFVLYRRLE